MSDQSADDDVVVPISQTQPPATSGFYLQASRPERTETKPDRPTPERVTAPAPQRERREERYVKIDDLAGSAKGEHDGDGDSQTAHNNLKTILVITCLTTAAVTWLATFVVFSVMFVRMPVTSYLIIAAITSVILTVMAGRIAYAWVSSRFAPEHVLKPKVTPHRLTKKVAELNARNSLPGKDIEVLMPEDLEELFYDERKNLAYVRTLFVRIFSRKKHSLKRALLTLLVVWLLVLVAVLALVATLFSTFPPTLLRTAAICSLVYFVLCGVCLWWTLSRIRFVISNRIIGEIWRTWPFLPASSTYIFSRNLSESTYTQPFWGGAILFNYTNAEIRTSEQREVIDVWDYAAHPIRFSAALQKVKPPKPVDRSDA